MTADVGIAFLLAALMLGVSYLGYYVTIHPPSAAREMRRAKIFFGLLSAISLPVIIYQAYRGSTAQAENRRLLDQIEKNTTPGEHPSPDLISLRKDLSQLLGGSAAVLMACANGPTPECVTKRMGWEGSVKRVLLSATANPAPAARWSASLAQNQNGPPLTEVSNEVSLLSEIISLLK